MATRTERNRRYQEKLKGEREELAQLREEKKRWEEDRKRLYSILQPGVNDLIDKYNDLLQHVFNSEDDELNNEMIESYRVNFIKLPDIEITDEAVANVEDTHEDDEETSQEPLEEKEDENEPDENTQSDDEVPDDPIENAAPDDEESNEVTEDEDYDEDYDVRQEVASNKHIPPHILAQLAMDEDWNDEDEISERMGRGEKYDMLHRYSPERSHPRLFVSFDDLDTQEKIKRALQMGELANMSEAFQKTLFQSDPVLRQEWEDYQEVVLGGHYVRGQ